MDGGSSWTDLGAAGIPEPVRLWWLEVAEVGGRQTLVAATNSGIFSTPVGLVFEDGFETGGTDGWSAAIGD